VRGRRNSILFDVGQENTNQPMRLVKRRKFKMKGKSLLLLIVLLSVPSLLWSQDVYLTKILLETPENQSLVTKWDLRTYALIDGVLICELGKEKLEILKEKNINFEVLDDDPELGQYYLLEPGPRSSAAPDLLLNCQVLGRVNDRLIIKCKKEALNLLSSLGFEIRRLKPIHISLEKPLVEPEIPRLESKDPQVQSIVDQVMESQVAWYDKSLSGDDPVFIGGQIDSILTRYSPTTDIVLAGDYLYQKFKNLGLDVEFQYYYGGALRGVSFVDSLTGWSVGQDGSIIATTDGGKTWKSQESEAWMLWGVQGYSPNLAWAVGDGGMILKTTDGGANWNLKPSGTTVFLFGVHFIDSLQGWICGDSGKILHTTNAGETWTSQTTPTSSRLYSIDFVDANNGWAVGREGRIIHTTNGGTSWTLQTSGTSQRLYGVDFVNPSEGWAVGWSGVIRHTTDGGTTWSGQSSGTNNYLYGVSFLNSQEGWIAGWGGTILKTTNGGTSWVPQTIPVANDLYNIFMLNAQQGWAVGDGIVLHTSDGLNWSSQVDGIEEKWRNVVATLPGTTNPDQQYIICGHFDSTSEIPLERAPGADDNASGTTAVITAAQILSKYRFQKTIKFIAFSGEEQGLLGSFAYVSEAYANGDHILGALNFDMIGYDSNSDGVMELHCGTDPASISLGDVLIHCISLYGIPLNPQKITLGSSTGSDHASFWAYGYPAFLGIEDLEDFTPWYHTTLDRYSTLNPVFFTNYVKASLAALATVAVLDTTQTGTPLSLALAPQISVIPRGGELIFSGTLSNTTNQTKSGEVWTEVILPNGQPYPGNPVWGPRYMNVPRYKVYQKDSDRTVPNNAPLGIYTYPAKTGIYPNTVWDQSSFQFMVTATPGGMNLAREQIQY